MFFPLDLEREHHIEINVCFNLFKFSKIQHHQPRRLAKNVIHPAEMLIHPANIVWI